jgi:hypothetical protein
MRSQAGCVYRCYTQIRDGRKDFEFRFDNGKLFLVGLLITRNKSDGGGGVTREAEEVG